MTQQARGWIAVVICCAGLAGLFVASKFFPTRIPSAGPSAATQSQSDSPATSPGRNSHANDHEPPVEQLPGFRSVTAAAGITFKMRFLEGEQGVNFKVNLYDHGCGVAVGDCDGDGDDDIYFCNQLGPNALYRNEGDGKFKDVTAESGPIALDDRICVGATFSDYDNDGDQDLYVTSTRGGNALFRNDGRGVFQNVTEEAGLKLIAHSQTASFFDYDLDGDLDLLVVNSASWTTDEFNRDDRYYVGPDTLFTMFARPIEKNVFYRNEGDGTFQDVTSEVGLEGRGWGSDAAILDFDEDGRHDVVVTNMFGPSQLYRNQPDGTFRDVTRDTLGRTSWGAIGVAAADFRNRGRLDLFITDMHSDMWMAFSTPASEIEESKKYKYVTGKLAERSSRDLAHEQKLADFLHLDYEAILFGNSFFQNQGGGKFQETSDASGLETFWPWGIAVGDFDNDGFQDLFVPSGMGYPYFYWRNYLLMNKSDGTFADQSRVRGIEPRPGGPYQEEAIVGDHPPRSSRGAATLDFDGDGRLDLVVNNFNDRPELYRNEFPATNYVQFRLQGVQSNRDAIGAVVRLFIGDEVLSRQVNPASGYLSHSSKTLHFGLGDRKDIDRAEIRWPNGKVQRLDTPAINQRHTVTEQP